MGPQYWLVGANWGGDDKADVFFRRGYWELGWPEEDQPGMAAQVDQIRPGDRIAVKSMLGQGSSEIAVLALGIVKEVAEDKRVHIEWVVTGLERTVPSKGCYKTIHGPYTIPADASWLGQVFRL